MQKMQASRHNGARHVCHSQHGTIHHRPQRDRPRRHFKVRSRQTEHGSDLAVKDPSHACWSTRGAKGLLRKPRAAERDRPQIPVSPPGHGDSLGAAIVQRGGV